MASKHYDTFYTDSLQLDRLLISKAAAGALEAAPSPASSMRVPGASARIVSSCAQDRAASTVVSTCVTGTTSVSRVASVVGTTKDSMAAAGQDALSLASTTQIVTSIGGGRAAGDPIRSLEAEVSVSGG